MFTLSDEHRMLQEAAHGFVQERMSTALTRRLRDARESFDRSLWGEMAAMGWTGILVPEEFGGAGLDRRALGLVLEECGRTLAPSPLHSTAMVGAIAIARGGDEATKKDILPKIADGSLIVAFAVDEGPHHRLRVRRRRSRAERSRAPNPMSRTGRVRMCCWCLRAKAPAGRWRWRSWTPTRPA